VVAAENIYGDVIDMSKFKINRRNSILIIIDIQDRLAAAMKDKDTMIANCVHLIEAAKIFDIPVIVTEQYPKGLGSTVPDIQSALTAYKPYEKAVFDCCGEISFVDRLKSLGRSHVILTGIEAHVCVLQTCLSLLVLGFHTHCIMDALCSRSRQNLVLGQELMRDAGAVITSTEAVLFQLLEKAGSPEFKMISDRIK